MIRLVSSGTIWSDHNFGEGAHRTVLNAFDNSSTIPLTQLFLIINGGASNRWSPCLPFSNVDNPSSQHQMLLCALCLIGGCGKLAMSQEDNSAIHDITKFEVIEVIEDI